MPIPRHHGHTPPVLGGGEGVEEVDARGAVAVKVVASPALAGEVIGGAVDHGGVGQEHGTRQHCGRGARHGE